MGDLVEEMIKSGKRAIGIGKEENWGNRVWLGMVIGMKEKEWVEEYVRIAKSEKVQIEVRILALGTAVEVVESPKIFEECVRAMHWLKPGEMRDFISKRASEKFKELCEDFKYDNDFTYLIKASCGIDEVIRNNEIILRFADLVIDLENADTVRILDRAVEIIRTDDVGRNDPTICWIGGILYGYLRDVDAGEMKEAENFIENIAVVLKNDAKENIRQRYLALCRSFNLQADEGILRILQPEISDIYCQTGLLLENNSEGFLNFQYEITGDKAAMKLITEQYIENVLQIFRKHQEFNVYKVGYELAEIANADQNLMYKIIVEKWEKTKDSFYAQKPWKLILSALKKGKVLRLHHFLELEDLIRRYKPKFMCLP
jgi:hypothetical protein